MEPLLESMSEIVEDVYSQIQQYLNGSYMLFGHSMGALLGNLLLHKLNNNNKPLPVCFLATGCSSPFIRGTKNKIHDLDEASFKQKIIQLGGLPKELIENQELLDYIFPILRSDIKAIETNVYAENATYNVPIKIFCGLNENIKLDDIKDWQKETSATFSYHFLKGNHFFILDHMELIANTINVSLLKESKAVF